MSYNSADGITYEADNYYERNGQSKPQKTASIVSGNEYALYQTGMFVAEVDARVPL